MDLKDEVEFYLAEIQERADEIPVMARAIAAAYADDPDEARSLLSRASGAVDVVAIFLSHEAPPPPWVP